jgi:hypothetical protein
LHNIYLYLFIFIFIETWHLQQPVLDAERLTNHSFTALGTVVSLGTFGTKLVSRMLIFFITQNAHDWINSAAPGPRGSIFLAGLWWFGDTVT